MTYSEFQKSGRLGCAQCYEAFATPIETTLRRIHGNAEHHGKIPAEAGAGLSKKRKAEELKQKIAKAVAAEDYETAASLHKELKNLDS
jgi:protein arginine kinase activator